MLNSSDSQETLIHLPSGRRIGETVSTAGVVEVKPACSWNCSQGRCQSTWEKGLTALLFAPTARRRRARSREVT